MNTQASSHSMVYQLDDQPPLLVTLLVAVQHLLAVFGGILTAPLVIALGMGLSVEQTSYLISSALVVSGFATAIQIFRQTAQMAAFAMTYG